METHCRFESFSSFGSLKSGRLPAGDRLFGRPSRRGVGVAAGKIEPGLFAAGVVMGENNGGGAVCDHVGKDFSRVDLAAVEETNGDDPLFYDLVCAVE